ncbi:hypothetical protein BVJ63_08035 [Vibrio cholerae]|uniref:hypothetical protein n=1 Tax=Vibrio cholerae TaxID=666 RepID=UPI001A9F2F6D|nr:hypothetical protein [Vibrio cholerae]MBO1380989.1 hypothetical protein [Vibrio cholerae]MBO1388751.1 hypothetical protein [Vibrio cholerae]MBO1395220.1 hypothetical protein [Vibrio cholerae]
MSFYLSSALASNRKGRFLQAVAGAIPLEAEWLSSPPSSGLLLVQAEELNEKQTLIGLFQWAMQTGCSALVINPQPEQHVEFAELQPALDWTFAPASLISEDPGLTAVLASETNQAVVGFVGSADHRQHMAGDVVHTRYVRKHSNSGLFAITTLPLWSLNLLDHTEALVGWLNWFVDHAGVATPVAEEKAELAAYLPDKYDLVVLLLLYAGHGKSLVALVDNDTVKLMFDVNSLDVIKRSETLQLHGFIHETGLTESGKASLQASQYWAYAPLLSEQLDTGAL